MRIRGVESVGADGAVSNPCVEPDGAGGGEDNGDDKTSIADGLTVNRDVELDVTDGDAGNCTITTMAEREGCQERRPNDC